PAGGVIGGADGDRLAHHLTRMVHPHAPGEIPDRADHIDLGCVDGIGRAVDRRGGKLPRCSVAAMIRAAPASRAPWIAAKPTPPQPITSTLSPGRTTALRSTAPTPVVTPHPSSAARSSGSDLSIGTTAAAGISVYSARVAAPIDGHTG